MVLKRIGIRKAVLVTALCQSVCGAIRILFSLVPVSRGVYFWAIFVSQFFGALPNALLAALPAEISSHWFGEHERSVATAIGTLAQLVGIGGKPLSVAVWHLLSSLSSLFSLLFCLFSLLSFFSL